jgi:hypothetical protein
VRQRIAPFGEVFHRKHICNNFVTKKRVFSVIWDVLKKVLFEFNILQICLNFRQIAESPETQRKIPGHRNISSDLSTAIGDSLGLDPYGSRLQAWPENHIWVP